MTRSRLSPKDRRKQLLAAAMKLAEAHGWQKVTHAMISAECGCSTALVFRRKYFPTAGCLQLAIAEEAKRGANPMQYPRAFAEVMLGDHGAEGAAALLANHFTDLLDSRG